MVEINFKAPIRHRQVFDIFYCKNDPEFWLVQLHSCTTVKLDKPNNSEAKQVLCYRTTLAQNQE